MEPFHFNDGQTANSVGELREKVELMQDSDFYFYVNSEKNDFANWIEHVVGDHNLGEGVRTAQNKSELVAALGAGGAPAMEQPASDMAAGGQENPLSTSADSLFPDEPSNPFDNTNEMEPTNNAQPMEPTMDQPHVEERAPSIEEPMTTGTPDNSMEIGLNSDPTPEQSTDFGSPNPEPQQQPMFDDTPAEQPMTSAEPQTTEPAQQGAQPSTESANPINNEPTASTNSFDFSKNVNEKKPAKHKEFSLNEFIIGIILAFVIGFALSTILIRVLDII